MIKKNILKIKAVLLVIWLIENGKQSNLNEKF